MPGFQILNCVFFKILMSLFVYHAIYYDTFGFFLLSFMYIG